jgi:hypothetical protein
MVALPVGVGALLLAVVVSALTDTSRAGDHLCSTEECVIGGCASH